MRTSVGRSAGFFTSLAGIATGTAMPVDSRPRRAARSTVPAVPSPAGERTTSSRSGIRLLSESPRRPSIAYRFARLRPSFAPDPGRAGIAPGGVRVTPARSIGFAADAPASSMRTVRTPAYDSARLSDGEDWPVPGVAMRRRAASARPRSAVEASETETSTRSIPSLPARTRTRGTLTDETPMDAPVRTPRTSVSNVSRVAPVGSQR